MKKPVIISLIVLGLIAFGVVFLLADTSKAPDNGSQAGQDQSITTDTPTSPGQTAGAYVDYSETALANTTGTKLLFFHAPWCPQCRDLEADIKSQGVPDGTTIFKVDYDTNQALRQKYGVTIQTTVVLINDQGELSRKFVAYDDPTLQAVVTNIFSR